MGESHLTSLFYCVWSDVLGTRNA